MSLKTLPIKIEYEGTDNAKDEFYTPCLENSIKYFRSSGFFSSTAYDLLKKEFADFALKGGKIQLIISHKIKEPELNEISEGYELKNQIEHELISEIKHDLENDLSKLKYAFISELIAIGALQIKVAFVTNNKTDSSMFHLKKSVFIDSNNDFITTQGSQNESIYGIHHDYNWESFNTFKSWIDGQNEYAQNHKDKFEELWDPNNDITGLKIIHFPERCCFPRFR